MANITVSSLREAGAEHWFDVGPTPSDVQSALQSLNEAITSGKVNPGLRLVAYEDGEAIGRFAARFDSPGRFYFWQPECRASLPLPKWREVTALLLEHAVHLGASYPTLTYFETKPADDLVHPDDWLDVLVAAGFHEVQCSRLYRRSLSAGEAEQASTTSALRWVGPDAMNEDTIGDLIDECDRDTLDRADIEYGGARHAHWHDIKQVRPVPWDRELTSIAMLGSDPVGIVICGIESANGDGWVMFVGTAPRARHRGIGAQLLGRALRSFRTRGITHLKALIDDQNAASIRLHETHGFRPDPERYMIYRKPKPSVG